MYHIPYQPPQPLKQSLCCLFITLTLLTGFLSISCASGSQTPTMSATDTANAYYQAIENKDYAKAYSYLSPDFPVGAHEAFSQQKYIAFSQSEDASAGPVTNFKQLGNGMNNDTAIVTVSVTRGNQSSTVQLELQQNKGVWQIIREDDV